MSKIDKIYSNKPKLFTVGGNANAHQPQVSSQVLWQQQMQFQQQQQQQQQPYYQQYPSQFLQQTQQQHQFPQQMQQFPSQNYQNWQQGQQDMTMNLNTFSSMPPQQQYQQQTTFQTQPMQTMEQFQAFNQQNTQQEQPEYMSSKRSAVGGVGQRFDMRRMPPPPPPPPEMIQALMSLMSNTQQVNGGGVQQSQQYQYQQQQYQQSDVYRAPPIQMPATSMMPQSLLRPSGQRLKLTSHVYKNQNASTAPLKANFYKAPDKNQTKASEKEKLYKPNTGYTIEEEEVEKKEIVPIAEPINIVIRGQDDLINSGVTTEMDDDDDDQQGFIKAADRNYIQSKFLASDSITESQFKEHLPRLYVDPKHAVTIEENKIIEKERQEDEFQKKKEVFLVKSKYKILAEIEKEKSKKLMEKLLKTELDQIEKVNREQEIVLQLQGEEMLKQKQQAKDLELIIKDIREERDYKMINKVLGLNLEKPLDEIIDLEKIKADYQVEAMYKRNEELYEETNRLLRENDYYVDYDGKSYNAYDKKPMSRRQNRSSSRRLSGLSENSDASDESELYESQYGKSKRGMGESSMLKSQVGGGQMNSSSRVRFIQEKDVKEETEQQKKQNEFYRNLQKEVDEAQMKLDQMCESVHESEDGDDAERQSEQYYGRKDHSFQNRSVSSGTGSQQSQKRSQANSAQRTQQLTKTMAKKDQKYSSTSKPLPSSKNSTIKRK